MEFIKVGDIVYISHFCLCWFFQLNVILGITTRFVCKKRTVFTFMCVKLCAFSVIDW